MDKKFIYILLVFIVLFCACAKKSAKSSSTKQNIIMNAMINGKPWSSSMANVNLVKANNLQITITVDSGNTNLNLYIANYVGTGVYPLINLNNVSDSPNRAYFIKKSSTGDSSVTHIATDGQIIVQNNYEFGESTTGIQGYFNFDADSISVTNGYFNVLLSLN